MFGLLGPNGAGKTTTVRMLTTLLAPNSGSARVAGFDVVSEANEVRRNIGLVGQYASVDELLSGRQNLIMIGRLHGLSRAAAKRRADELLDRFDLGTTGNKAASTYSGGMRRRLDLAASLVIKPPVLFLDEPTTGLDPTGRAATWEVIADMTRDGTTVLLTTQYLDEADRFAEPRRGDRSWPSRCRRHAGRAQIPGRAREPRRSRWIKVSLAGDLAQIVTPFAFGAPFAARRRAHRAAARLLTVTADLHRPRSPRPASRSTMSASSSHSMDDVFFELTGHARLVADADKELAA